MTIQTITQSQYLLPASMALPIVPILAMPAVQAVSVALEINNHFNKQQESRPLLVPHNTSLRILWPPILSPVSDPIPPTIAQPAWGLTA